MADPPNSHHHWLARLALILLVLATSLPFLDQAYHIDDRIYVDVARNILHKPLYPYDFAALYEGFVAPDAASHSHLPFTSYYLALVQLATGSEDERAAHLAFLIFPLLGALAFYELARNLLRFPLAGAALLVVSTAFLTLSHTLMPDVPLLSCWILALACFHRSLRDPGSTRAWTVCLGALLVASFMSLLTFCLLLLLGADWVLQKGSSFWKDERRIRIALLLAAPFLLWLLWYLRAWLHYDRIVLVNTFLHMEQRAPFSAGAVGWKLLSFLLHMGATFLFPLAGWLAFTSRSSRRFYAVFFFLAFIPAYVWYPEWPWRQALLFSVFLTAAVPALVSLTRGTLRLARDLWSGTLSGNVFWPRGQAVVGRDSAALLGVLFLWFWGILAACGLAFYSGSARYALLALPPFLLLWQYSLETGHSRGAARSALLVCLILTLPYSLGIASADYRFAGVYREAAAGLMPEAGDGSRQLWYAGEWGFRYYLEKIGARPLTKTGVEPRQGDLIIKPYIALPWITLYDSEEFVRLREQRDMDPGSPLRILDFHTSAGFYSTAWGILPFSLGGTQKWEWFNIFEVRKKYDGPVPEIERPW